MIVAPFTGWLRASMAFLFDNGLRMDSIRYVEFEPLVHGEDRLLWVGEPFAPWTAAPVGSVPAELRAAFDFKRWYTVADEDAWFAVEEEQRERVPFVRGHFLEAAEIEGQSRQYVALVGEYAKESEYFIVRG